MKFSKFIVIAFAFSILNANAGSRVVAYGDSGVYGKGVARNETYPAQLEAMLRQKGFDVSVKNDGVNGRTTEDAAANIGNVGKADVVIVQVGVNDAKHGVPAATIRKNVEAVIEKLKAAGSAVLVVSYPSANVCDVASSHGAPCVMWGGLPGAQYHVPGDPQNHFNAAGLRVMASRILPAVEKALGQKR